MEYNGLQSVRDSGPYELRNGYKKVVVSKESLLPLEQTIELENGDTLSISYDTPSRIALENGTGIADISLCRGTSPK